MVFLAFSVTEQGRYTLCYVASCTSKTILFLSIYFWFEIDFFESTAEEISGDSLKTQGLQKIINDLKYLPAIAIIFHLFAMKLY